MTKPSLRRAVNAFCKGCLYDPNATGTWREQVAACSDAKCALWPVRTTENIGSKRGQNGPVSDLRREIEQGVGIPVPAEARSPVLGHL